MTISQDSSIYIDPSTGIVVEEAGFVVIGGGRIVLDYDTDKFPILVDEIKEKEDYSITIIQGAYNGSFDDIVILKPSDACEEVGVSFAERGKGIIGVFSLNEEKCPKSLPIWAIVLITIGAIIVLVAIFLIIGLVYKPLGKKIYPFKYRVHNK